MLNEPSDGVRARFLHEARSLARLNHPHIVTVYDAVESDGLSYIVMELAEGPNLFSASRSLPRATTLAHVLDVLDALAYAHERDVLHRDIKPSNIALTKNGVKIMDFGLSRRISDLAAGTHAGEVVGTIAYLPPERFLGRPSDARGDLYSIGIVLYELLAGVVPFRNDGEDLVAIIFAHVNEVPRSPSVHDPTIGEALERIVLRLLAKDPQARFPGARELHAALGRAIA